MANQIRMTPDQMRARAGQYRGEADKVGETIRSMDMLLGYLQSEWEGAASESYAARYQELKPGFIKVQELITEIAASLDMAARILEETDASIASAFRG
ncbi:MAG: WXG100 family type VII secretion target [Firmicutes bacterium]|nr:WXG100 family type VII secretion target [Bacillota bacterium]